MGKKRGRQPTFFSISKSILGVDIIHENAVFGVFGLFWGFWPFLAFLTFLRVLGGFRGSHLEGPVYK